MVIYINCMCVRGDTCSTFCNFHKFTGPTRRLCFFPSWIFFPHSQTFTAMCNIKIKHNNKVLFRRFSMPHDIPRGQYSTPKMWRVLWEINLKGCEPMTSWFIGGKTEITLGPFTMKAQKSLSYSYIRSDVSNNDDNKHLGQTNALSAGVVIAAIMLWLHKFTMLYILLHV